MTSKIFIGSSVESLAIAKAIQANLHYYDFYTKIWSQGIFAPSTFPLDSLLKSLDDYDFGVFVFTPDDVVRIRGNELGAVRDNVIFEMGLFIGKLGKERTFFVMPHSSEPLRLASDLLGLQPVTYNPNNPDKRAALGVASEEIYSVVDKLKTRFRVPDSLVHITEKARKVGDKQAHLYTFWGLQVEREPGIRHDAVIGISSLYRLWADPTDAENLIKARVVLDEEPNVFRITFQSAPGSYPANVTIRPSGLYPFVNVDNNKYLAFDVRAAKSDNELTNECSKEIGISVRLVDETTTMWNKGIVDPEQFPIPVDANWHTIHIDLSKEWFLFGTVRGASLGGGEL